VTVPSGIATPLLRWSSRHQCRRTSDRFVLLHEARHSNGEPFSAHPHFGQGGTDIAATDRRVDLKFQGFDALQINGVVFNLCG